MVEVHDARRELLLAVNARMILKSVESGSVPDIVRLHEINLFLTIPRVPLSPKSKVVGFVPHVSIVRKLARFRKPLLYPLSYRLVTSLESPVGIEPTFPASEAGALIR